MRWAGHVAYMGERRGAFKLLEDPAVGGRIILKWIFVKWEGVMNWIDLVRVGDTCECGNEHSGSIKCGEFLD